MSFNFIIVNLFLYCKNQFLKNLCSGTQCEGFQFLLILDLWGISLHAVVVFALGKNLLFKSVLAHCGFHAQNPISSTFFRDQTLGFIRRKPKVSVCRNKRSIIPKCMNCVRRLTFIINHNVCT